MGQTRKRIRPVLVIPALLALVAASACGQRGPLYLPGSTTEMQTIEPPAAEAPGGDVDEDSDEDPDAEG